LLPDFDYPVFSPLVYLLPDFGYPVYSPLVYLLPDFDHPAYALWFTCSQILVILFMPFGLLVPKDF
jgi:hypothetical protein